MKSLSKVIGKINVKVAINNDWTGDFLSAFGMLIQTPVFADMRILTTNKIEQKLITFILGFIPDSSSEYLLMEAEVYFISF